MPLSADVRNALTEVLSKSEFTGPDDLVFGSDKGTPLDDKNVMERQIKPMARRLGMAWVSWHVFRHTHATLGDLLGMGLADRQAQLGHGDVRMTMHYTHQDLSRRREVIER